VADIDWDDVEALQANLSSVAEAAQTVILAHVNNDLNAAAFGGEDAPGYHLARCYLAAHLGELARRNGSTTGAVQSKTIGTSSITIQYATAMTATPSALRLTSWGTMYAELLASSPLRIGRGS
jgi:hypothetical protein